MYIGLKQIQYQLGDYSTLLTSSDGIHALTGWNKLYDAPQPLTIHLLYTCTYTPELLSFPFIQDIHLLCIVPEDINMDILNSQFPDFVIVKIFSDQSVYFFESIDQRGTVHIHGFCRCSEISFMSQIHV